MPARELYFTIDPDIKINKKTVAQFVEEFEDGIKMYFPEIKQIFNVDSINTEFLKKFISEIKKFDSVSCIVDEIDTPVQMLVMDMLLYLVAEEEPREPVTLFGLKFLYETWEHEGCGYDDYDYITYINEAKLIKKFTKDAKKAVDKLNAIGLEVEFSIK